MAVIPLAKKLKDCGVFGKSSDEFLNYAEANRAEWVKKGEHIVAEMVEELSKVTFTAPKDAPGKNGSFSV